ncbi:MAG: hypothetical protein ACXWC3_27610 [Burkholderiales bacterium]
MKIQKATYCGNSFAGFPIEQGALLVVRRHDCAAKMVKGKEARLADSLMWESGLEEDWDSVMEKLSGDWKSQIKGFAISEASDHIARD